MRARPRGKARRPDQGGRAQELGLPVEQPANFDDPATLETLKGYNADLMVMAFVNVFVPEAARDTPTHGSICFHPSLLPLHRGPRAVNWPIIMGSTKSGYSWFYPSDGLDEGDSLIQWECEIGPDDTVIDLYFKKIYPHAVDSVLTVCDLFRTGNPPRIVPDEAQATYERRCTKKHARIDWNKPVGQVYDLIRGTNPAPGAWTTLGGTEVQIYDCARGPGDGVSGKVVDISNDGVWVQLIGGRLCIKRVRPQGEGKIPAAEWAASAGLKPGDVLAEPDTRIHRKTGLMSDIEIARKANKKPIQEIGAKLDIPTDALLPYGHDKAKVSADFIKAQEGKPDGHLILVTAINPTPAGEGKTTTTVGLGDGLNAIGKKAMICIREASLGPNFGMKGGAAGGGYAQVVPMEEMNLHFTGDFHAITSAHNLLSAMIDNHIYWGNEQGIDIRRIAWRRVSRHERPGAAVDRL